MSTAIASPFSGSPFDSSEVRWFFEGAIPDAAREWLDALAGSSLRPEVRTDRYLVPTDSALGIKLRNSRLELKRRIESGPIIPCGTFGAGHLEKWRKWGFELADAVRPDADETDWIAVEKRRWSVRLAPESGVLSSARGQPGSCPSGCNLEVGSVCTSSGPPFWTICLEAFGTEHDRDVLLRRAASLMLGTAGCPMLPLEASFGYPVWILQRLQASQNERYQGGG